MHTLKHTFAAIIALITCTTSAVQGQNSYVPITLEEIQQGVPFIIAADAAHRRAATVLYNDHSIHSTTEEANFQFYHAVPADEEPGYYKILQENGLVIGVERSNDTNLAQNINPYWQFEAAESGETGQFKIANLTGNGNSNRCLSFSGTSVKYYAQYADKDMPYLFKLASADTDHFAISESGYATLYVDHAFIMPERVTGGYITESIQSLNAGEGPTYELHYNWSFTPGTPVPAQTALILRADQPGTAREYTYERCQTDLQPPVNNMMHGSLTASLTQVEGDNYYYQLSYNNDTERLLGFWWAAEGGAPFTNGANKAYLAIPKDHEFESSPLGFDLGDKVTGISEATRQEQSNVEQIYTLDGKRVAPERLGSLPAGVYIVNGRKTYIP